MTRAARSLGDAAQGGDAELEAGVADPARTLSRLLDLRGSVDVARALAAKATPSYVSDDPRMPSRIAWSVQGEIGAIRSHARRAFARLSGERSRLPDAGRVHAELVARGALGVRSARALTSAAEAIFAPYAEEASSELTSVVRQARSLRKEIGPDLASLGPEAARLERLDALLAAATEAAIDVRLGRLVPAAKGPFTGELARALDALGEGAAAPDVARWWIEGGLLRRLVDSLEAIVMVALEFEEGRITSLVSAASRCALLPPRQPSPSEPSPSEPSPSEPSPSEPAASVPCAPARGRRRAAFEIDEARS